MKPTELMLNDWVVVYKKSLPVKAQVECVSKYTITALGESRLCDNVMPVTLTLEILERNGFELCDDFLYHRIDDKPHHYDFKLKNGGVFTSEGYTLECGIYHLTIRYVHELQNALRLCGLNDLADNLKVEE